MHFSNSARNPFRWMELTPSTPSGLFLDSGHTPARHLIFRHRTGYSYTLVAVQLDETPERPAFSFRFLEAETGILGVHFGETRIVSSLDNHLAIAPKRCGLLREEFGGGVAIKCTTPSATSEWLRMDDLSSHMLLQGPPAGNDCIYQIDAASRHGALSNFFNMFRQDEYFLASYDPELAASSRHELDFGPKSFSKLRG